MARETVALCKCLLCQGDGAEIRRNVKQKLYLFCADGCGLVQATGPRAQAVLQAALDAVAPTPAAEPDAAPDLAGLDNPTGQPVATETKKRRGFLDALADPIL